MAKDNIQQRILRLPEVSAMVGLGRTQVYDLMKRGDFPRQVQLTERSVGWLESEILSWIKERAENRRVQAA